MTAAAASFPEGFLFGTATSATQVEGHCDLTDWAAFAREPGRVKNGDTPATACDGWNRFDADVAIQRELSMNAHRLSIEWARVEPRPGEFDTAALDRYRGWLGALRDAGIAPMVTLHHFSIPLWLRDRGGLLADDFAERIALYAARTFRALSDLCSTWVTINEPNVLAAHSYLLGAWPPAARSFPAAVRAHHALLEAHVAMYRALHHEDRAGRAEVGLAHHLRVVEPKDPRSRGDRAAAAGLRLVFNDAFAGAICDGRMVGPLDRLVRTRSGFRIANAKGTQDFFGVNYYSRDVVRFSRAHAAEGFAAREVAKGAEVSDLGWEIFPAGLGSVLREWAARSGRHVYVTENGIADATDTKRPAFLLAHLAEVARAIADGVDVRGYYHWSLLDNFEWAEGYTPRFGLVAVDYATQARTIRPSGRLYAEIARSRMLPSSR
jgi:beta-glucosidase